MNKNSLFNSLYGLLGGNNNLGKSRFSIFSGFSSLFLCFCFFISLCLYGIAHYLLQKQDILYRKVAASEVILAQHRSSFQQLSLLTEELKTFLKGSLMGSGSRTALADFLKGLAAKHHLLSFRVSFLPTEPLMKGPYAHLQKIPIRLQFATGLDDNVWVFLKELHATFPGVTVAQDLSLEKEQSTLPLMPASSVLKGTYLFDWYVLVPL